MKETTRFVGLDIHAETIAVAVAEPGRGEVRSIGIISNDVASMRKLIQKLGKKDLRFCYEAGPTGSIPANGFADSSRPSMTP